MTPFIETIRRMYVDQRMSLIEIAEQMNCSSNTISRRLTSAGVVLRSPKEARKNVMPDELARMVRMYQEGVSIKQISLTLKRSDATVWAQLKGAGIQLRRPIPRDHEAAERRKRDRERKRQERAARAKWSLTSMPRQGAPIITFLPEAPHLQAEFEAIMAKVREERRA